MSGRKKGGDVVSLRPTSPPSSDQLPKTGHALLDDLVLRAFSIGRGDALGTDDAADWWDLEVAIKAVKQELDR